MTPGNELLFLALGGSGDARGAETTALTIDLIRIIRGTDEQLFFYLVLNRARTVPPTELLEHLYGDDDAREANALEAVVTRMRRKLGPGIVATRRGFGYLLEGGA